MMVSVCIATFNGEQFIEDQLISILKQIDDRDEVIISDDSSTDRTIDVIKKISDPRIRLFEGKLFRDPIQNFQFALTQAKGDLIFLSDQDDIWLDEKYEDMKALLQSHVLVVSNSMIVNQDLEVINPSFFSVFKSGKGILKNVIRSTYYGSCMAFRKQLLIEALPFPATKEIGHDLWLGLVAELTGSVFFYEKPLLLYRRHQSAFTPEGLKSKRSIYQMLIGRFVMFNELLKFQYTKHIKWKKD
jgi:glycosyltransferase involved in cell wall biosynthesis